MLPALLSAAQVTVIDLNADLAVGKVALLQIFAEPIAVFENRGAIVVAAVNGQHDEVLGSQPRRQHQPVVIAVRHHERADQPGRDAPGRGPRVRFAPF